MTPHSLRRRFGGGDRGGGISRHGGCKSRDLGTAVGANNHLGYGVSRPYLGNAPCRAHCSHSRIALKASSILSIERLRMECAIDGNRKVFEDMSVLQFCLLHMSHWELRNETAQRAKRRNRTTNSRAKPRNGQPSQATKPRNETPSKASETAQRARRRNQNERLSKATRSKATRRQGARLNRPKPHDTTANHIGGA